MVCAGYFSTTKRKRTRSEKEKEEKDPQHYLFTTRPPETFSRICAFPQLSSCKLSPAQPTNQTQSNPRSCATLHYLQRAFNWPGKTTQAQIAPARSLERDTVVRAGVDRELKNSTDAVHGLKFVAVRFHFFSPSVLGDVVSAVCRTNSLLLVLSADELNPVSYSHHHRITGDVRCFVFVNREWLDGVELMAVM